MPAPNKKPGRPPKTAAQFKAWRKRLDLTQPAAAETLCLTRATIARYEGGNYPIPASITKLAGYVEADALGFVQHT